MLRIFVVMALLLAAAPALAQAPLKVVASFSILADIVSEIGGERIMVTTLVPAMGDAHVFQPAPADARRVAQADLLVASGLNFETWLDRLVAASGFAGPRIVATTGIRPLRIGAHSHAGHDHGDSAGKGSVDDPHVWHDLQRMQRYVGTIVAGLEAAAPASAPYFRARGTDYAARLAELDAWAAAEFAKLPRAHRKAITQHDAFGYLAARYQIDFLAPQGITTSAEASAEAVGRLVRQIRQQRVQALFFESATNPRLIEQISRETKVTIGGRLYSDTLSPPGGEADSYVKMFRLNVERLTAAMQRAG